MFLYPQHNTCFSLTEIYMEANEASCEISSSISRKRQKRNTSIVWNTSWNCQAQCQVCKEVFVAYVGITFLKRRLDKHLDNPQEHGYAQIDQIIYREKVFVAIIKHNYPFCFVEHQGNRDIHSYINHMWKLSQEIRLRLIYWSYMIGRKNFYSVSLQWFLVEFVWLQTCGLLQCQMVICV